MSRTHLSVLLLALVLAASATRSSSRASVPPSPAAEADRVVNLPGLPASLANLSQYAGLLPAGEGGSLFYWLVEHEGDGGEQQAAQAGSHDGGGGDSGVPLVLWLQGGPGASSLFSLFTETGPFRVAVPSTGDAPPSSSTTTSSGSTNRSGGGNTSIGARGSGDHGGGAGVGTPKLSAATVRWTQAAHVLYLDQPFGTGFSFARNDSLTDVVHSETALRDAAATALVNFFARHPRHAGRPFFIFGESFAGHMAPNIAWRLLQLADEEEAVSAVAEAPEAAGEMRDAAAADDDNDDDDDDDDGDDDDDYDEEVRGRRRGPNGSSGRGGGGRGVAAVNLQGLAIGDGWVEPTAQNRAFPAYAFATGLIGDGLRASLEARAADCAAVIAGGNYTAAFYGPCYYQMLNPIVAAAGGVSPYDIRVFDGATSSGVFSSSGSSSGGGGAHARYLAARRHLVSGVSAADGGAALQAYLDDDAVREALHLPSAAAGGKWGQGPGSSFVEQGLIPDLNAPTSLPLWPGLLARGVRVAVYNGNFDLICSHLGTDAYLRSALDWPGQAEFLAAPRKVWTAAPAQPQSSHGSGGGGSGKVAGWTRSGGNVTQIVIANAGHMAPGDAPDACFDMLRRFVADAPF